MTGTAPEVLKIGGSILNSEEDYAQTARLLARRIEGQPTWLVVSAAQRVTDELDAAARSPDEARVDSLLLRHAALAGQAVPAWLEAELRRGLHEARAAGSSRPVLAWGEQASAWAVQSRLETLGTRIPVVELYPRRRLPAHENAIVPGFYLRDRYGRARSLPRGGSDITAALVAHRLGSPLVRFWKEGGGIRGGTDVVVREMDGRRLLGLIGHRIRPLHPAALRIALHHGIDLVLEDPLGRWPPTTVGCRSTPRAAAVTLATEGGPQEAGDAE